MRTGLMFMFGKYLKLNACMSAFLHTAFNITWEKGKSASAFNLLICKSQGVHMCVCTHTSWAKTLPDNRERSSSRLSKLH